MYEEITAQLAACVRYLKQEGHLRSGAVVVLGCSTSEVAGGRIGKNSVPELGDALAGAMIDACRQLDLCPVFQCCEHLNRALGSTGAAAYQRFEHPALAMNIQADAAIDVGDTLVGMHIRPVAVPLRMGEGETKVGQAHVVMAYSRLPYIGGPRAQYPV